jgi:hypothetical protein
MNDALAWAILGVGVGILLLATFPLREKLAGPVVDGLLAVAGAAIGVGGLLFLDDVGPASWLVAPAFLAVGTIAHVRGLFAGDGPFRT